MVRCEQRIIGYMEFFLETSTEFNAERLF